MSDPAADVGQALALLKGLGFVHGRRDVAFDVITKQAAALLERAAGSLGGGAGPAAGGLEPSIIEWLFAASDTALQQAGAEQSLAPDAAAQPGRAQQILYGALLSIREWAVRQLPASRQPAESAGPEPLQLR